MNGIPSVDDASAEATTGHMLVTFRPGCGEFRFHLPAHAALKFREVVLRNTWQVCCAPDADVVPLKPARRKRKP